MSVAISTDRPSLKLTSITVSCPAPRELAEFYARLLGARVTASEPPLAEEPPDAGWAQIAAGALTVNFEYERHWTAPVWPAEPGHQTATEHLDIYVHDLAAATKWALDCGARVASVQPQDDVRVLFDPAGQPFCLFS